MPGSGPADGERDLSGGVHQVVTQAIAGTAVAAPKNAHVARKAPILFKTISCPEFEVIERIFVTAFQGCDILSIEPAAFPDSPTSSVADGEPVTRRI